MWTLARRTGIVIVAAGLIYLLLFLASIFLFPIFGDCAVTRSTPQVSPDGQLKAMVVTWDCGATTALSSAVLIASVHARFDERRDEVASFVSGSPRLEWSGRELRVFKGEATASKTLDEAHGVAVSYWSAD